MPRAGVFYSQADAPTHPPRAGAIEETDQLGDADTTDILTEIPRGTDKWLWVVEAHQQVRNAGAS